MPDEVKIFVMETIQGIFASSLLLKFRISKSIGLNSKTKLKLHISFEMNTNVKVQDIASTGQEIFHIENVTLHYINHDTGSIIRTVPNLYLRILLITKNGATEAFVQVENDQWIYPLVPGQSPIFKEETSSGQSYYIFPNLESNNESIGLSPPKSLTSQEINKFETLLLKLLNLDKFPNGQILQSPKTTKITNENESFNLSSTFAIKFMNGSEQIANTIVYGAEYAGTLIDAGFNLVQQKGISPATEDFLGGNNTVLILGKAMDQVSGKVVEISDYLASQLSEATENLGKFLLPHIRQTSENIYKTCTNSSPENSSEIIDHILTASGGAVFGIGTIYRGLKTGAKILGRSLADNTVGLIGHAFGTTAGTIAQHSSNTIENVLAATANASHFEALSLAHGVVVSTSEAVIQTTSPH